MKRPQLGFTLAELITALAVLMVLLGLGVPMFSLLLRSARLDSALHGLTASLAKARLAAISRQVPVSVCPSPDGARCRRDLVWEDGWIVFLDPERTGNPRSEEEVLQRSSPNLHGMAIRATVGRHYIRYQPSGFSSGTNATLRLCQQDPAIELGEIVVNNAGRTRTTRFRQPIPCPFAF